MAVARMGSEARQGNCWVPSKSQHDGDYSIVSSALLGRIIIPKEPIEPAKDDLTDG